MTGEHVTAYPRFRSDQFRHFALRCIPDCSQYRVTVDYADDLIALESLMAHLDTVGVLEEATTPIIVGAIEQRPDIQLALSAHERDLWRHLLLQKGLDRAA